MTNRNRNQPCPCGSGLKQKKCHADPVKIQLAQRAYKEKLDGLIEMEIDKKYDELKADSISSLEARGDFGLVI